MDTFNKIWQAVKYHCNHNDHIDTDCVKTVADKAQIRKDKLDLFLHTLQDLGLINYSGTNMEIRLTELGKKRKNICG